MIILKRIFILIYIPIIFFSFLILFSDLYGSPFYLILTEKRVKNYISTHYTSLEYGDAFYDGQYKATVYDRFGDSYTMEYDPLNDKVLDDYYKETVIVMRSLYRNNIRQQLNFEGIDIQSDEILIDIKIPMYFFEVGEIASGEKCECDITIELYNIYNDSITFGNDAFVVLKALRHSLIKINNLTVLGFSDTGIYSVSGNNEIYPADANTTIILTEFSCY